MTTRKDFGAWQPALARIRLSASSSTASITYTSGADRCCGTFS